MIFRRLASALRRQDWTIVLIELALVIAGVLVALQVNNWNGYRAERSAERALMERLHLDVQTTRDGLQKFAALRRARLEYLHTVSDIYFSDSELRPLTSAECSAIRNTHIISFPPADVPTLAEVFAGGQISLIHSDKVRSAILKLEQANGRSHTLFDALSRDKLELAHLHPDLLTIDVDRNDDGTVEVTAICDFKAMGESRAFLNDLASNTGRNSAYVLIMIDPLVDALDNLHAELDAVFSVTHAEETP